MLAAVLLPLVLLVQLPVLTALVLPLLLKVISPTDLLQVLVLSSGCSCPCRHFGLVPVLLVVLEEDSRRLQYHILIIMILESPLGLGLSRRKIYDEKLLMEMIKSYRYR